MSKIRNHNRLLAAFCALAVLLCAGLMITCDTGGSTGSTGSNGDPVLPGSISISVHGNAAAISYGYGYGPMLVAIYTNGGTETVEYQWNINNEAISGENGATLIPEAAGSYTVTVSAAGFISKTSNPLTLSEKVWLPLKDIDFEIPTASWTQSRVTSTIVTKMYELAAQSGELASRFADWKTELEKNGGSATQIKFAESMRDEYKNLQDVYENDYVENSKHRVLNANYRIKNEIGNLFSNETAKAKVLFETQLVAFASGGLAEEGYSAIGLNRVTQNPAGVKARAKANYDELCDLIEQWGGQRPPQQDSTYATAVTALKAALNASIPEMAGPHRGGIIQQLEDTTQFYCFIQDLLYLRKSTAISR